MCVCVCVYMLCVYVGVEAVGRRDKGHMREHTCMHTYRTGGGRRAVHPFVTPRARPLAALAPSCTLHRTLRRVNGHLVV